MLRRYYLAVLLLVAVVSNVCYAAWTISAPIGGAHNPSMSVQCTGTGDGAACDVYIRIYVGGVLKNFGTGEYDGSPLFSWDGIVAPPSGGFGSGEATVKVWKDSQNPDADDPVCQGNFSFM